VGAVPLELELERQTTLPLADAWERCRELLSGYRRLGQRVVFTRTRPPEAVAAELTDPSGTKLSACVNLAPRPQGALLSIQLRGQVNVAGPAALFATPEQVRDHAAAQLEPLLERALAAPRARPISMDELEEKLHLLAALRQRGLIDEADHARKKAELLARLV
jgi:hypothetical protein